MQRFRSSLVLALILTPAIILLITALAPLERTLGAGARLVYLHGAWVWTGKVVFAAASLTGLGGLIARHEQFRRISRTLGHIGLFFWWTYLPMSLVVQQANWGGIFWDEPRWRVPLTLGIVGLLLQIGLILMSQLSLTALVNTIYGIGLWILLANTQNVLHPDSPIFNSEAVRIQIFFVLLLALSLMFSALLTIWLHSKENAR